MRGIIRPLSVSFFLNFKTKTMKIEQLQRLLNEACELLIIFEDGNIASDEDKLRISAIFDEIKYADDIDDELALTYSEWTDKHTMSADDEAQDYNVFGKDKI
jgi:hypothetical protein